MSSCAKAKLTEFERHSRQNDLTGSPSKRNEGEGVDEDEDDEDEDVDFNPFLKGTPSPEASSSLSSDIEEVELDGDVIDSAGNNDIFIPVQSKKSRPVSEVQVYTAGDSEHGEEEIVMQTSVSPDGANEQDSQKTVPRKRKQGESVSISKLEIEKAGEKENGSISGLDANDVVVGESSDINFPGKSNIDSDDEDAICRRTRARYSLASFTLDELEAFLQETDDDDDLQNVDDEQEYRKFLAAVLQGKEGDGLTTEENENVDDEDEDNDADFEIELEEMLESDLDEGTTNGTQKEEFGRSGRRPETRQNGLQKAPNQSKKKLLEPAKKLLRPLIPILPNGLASSFPTVVEIYPSFPSSASQDGLINGFTPHQIGQLHCLIYEHVQLLIQIFSLCVLEPSRQQIASQVQGLIFEMLHKRNQITACRTEPYPSVYFRPPYTCSSVPHDSPQFCPGQSFVELSSAVHARACSAPNIQVPDFQGQMGSVLTVEGSLWMPRISGPLLSVMDVAPLSLVGRYMDDVRTAVTENRRRHVESNSDTRFEKEPMFPHPCFPSSVDANNEVVRGRVPSPANMVPSSNQQPPKKTLAATLVEKTRQQSIALVPKEIAKLAQIFLSLFNPALFPHKPPPAAVANRVLFTDSEDELLALGLMEYNSDWKAIQQRFLPCKSKHQIFVRQKNRCSSKASENPIKAVRRMKTSPLTAEEREAIQEGLRFYKLDWMSVWKFVVPHRDPSLLPRQWRVALGTQKSYKQDAVKKEKRRMYELKRRCNASDLENRQLASDKEDYPADKNGENDSGDNNNIDNRDKAFVHEAFLADWRPCASYLIPSKHPCSKLGEKKLPRYLMSQEDTHVREQPRYGSVGAQLFSGQTHENPCALKHSQHPNASPLLSHVSHSMPNTMQPNIPVSSTMSITSKSQVPLWPYRARTRLSNPHVVKLAPDLPPVNLPPSVRVIPHSAFKSNQCGASAKIKVGVGDTGKGNSIHQIPHVANSGSATIKSSIDKSNQDKDNSSNSKAEESIVIKDKSVVEERAADSDLQLHPLLFQAPEDGRRLPYYSLNCGNGASCSFSFFNGNQPQLNLSLFHNPHQAQHVVDRFNKYLKTKESTSAPHGIDFHPLLQRTDDKSNESAIACPTARLSVGLDCHPAQLHNPYNVTQSKFMANDYPSISGREPTSPNNKADELDLEIHLSSSRMDKSVGSRDVISCPTSSIVNVSSSGNATETENTSSPYHKHGKNCPRFGRKLNSGSHPLVEPRNDNSRCNVDDTGEQSNPEIVMEQEELSDSDEEIEENVEFECEEMADSEGEEGLGCEQITEMHHKEAACSESVEATGADCENQRQDVRTSSHPQNNASKPRKGRNPLLNLGLTSLGKNTYSSWLSLNSSAPARPLCMKTKYEERATNVSQFASNSASCRPSRSCKKTTAQKEVPEQKHVDMEQRLSLGPLAVPTVRKPRKRASRANTSMNIGPTSECQM